MPWPKYLPLQATAGRQSAVRRQVVVNMLITLLTCFTSVLPWVAITEYACDSCRPTWLGISLVQLVMTGLGDVRFDTLDQMLLFGALAIASTSLAGLYYLGSYAVQMFVVALLAVILLYEANGFAFYNALPGSGMGGALLGYVVIFVINSALLIVATGALHDRRDTASGA
jgi:hypothetical protein